MGYFRVPGGEEIGMRSGPAPPPDMSAAGSSPVKDVQSKEEVKHESHQMAG